MRRGRRFVQPVNFFKVFLDQGERGDYLLRRQKDSA
jgi:hypothetical protein